MIFRSIVLILVCIFTIRPCHGLFDPLSIGIGAVTLSALGYNYQTVKDHTYCKFTECCNADYIPAVISDLANELENHLYGQHIVIQQLIPALRAHFSPEENSKKPLVISFHGTPGTGKNYVSDYIAKILYKKGIESQFVHKFLGRSDFALESETSQYKKIVSDKVRNSIAKCPRSLFIFDEVDKMPAGIFESVTSLLDHHSKFNGVDYTKAIFIFLSNTAGVELSERLSGLMRAGSWREDTKLHDFEKILEAGAYNLEGGLQKSSIIEAHLIDHYIPFLPLEKKHVAKCLKAEFERWSVIPSDDDVQNIIQNFVSFDRQTGLFATSGCKTLEKKVAVAVKSGRL